MSSRAGSVVALSSVYEKKELACPATPFSSPKDGSPLSAQNDWMDAYWKQVRAYKDSIDNFSKRRDEVGFDQAADEWKNNVMVHPSIRRVQTTLTSDPPPNDIFVVPNNGEKDLSSSNSSEGESSNVPRRRGMVSPTITPRRQQQQQQQQPDSTVVEQIDDNNNDDDDGWDQTYAYLKNLPISTRTRGQGPSF